MDGELNYGMWLIDLNIIMKFLY